MAWDSLPPADQHLLRAIGASQWDISDQPLGIAADAHLRSGGRPGLSLSERDGLNHALGVWVRDLKIVLINASHPKLAGLDDQSREAFLSRVAWHEWAHALSIVRCSPDDIAAGERLLELAPDGIRKRVRLAGYSRRELTFEVVAESYALLMVRRLAGRGGRPSWLHDDIYKLVTRVTQWSG
jgi:hypothetical protein